VRLRPVPPALQLPAIDDVADEVELVGLVVPQEIQQIVGLAAGCSQVNVGNPDRPVPVYWKGRIVARLQNIRLVVMMARIKARRCYRGVTEVPSRPFRHGLALPTGMD
jgi:hypothetical protein